MEVIDSLTKEKMEDYKNSSLSNEERTKALLKVMTIDEKIAQMLCIWENKKDVLMNENGILTLEKFKKKYPYGIGQIARLSDTGGGLNNIGKGKLSIEMAKLSNEIQKFVKENTRLGIPVICHEETLHGLAAKEATSYPQPIGMASTFNPKLIKEIFEAIAKDIRMRGAHQALAPVVDVGRDPRWGRIEETFGEDPYLVTKCGLAAVKGLQENHDYPVISTLKHFVGHGQPESGTNIGPANYSERLMREIFFSPFKYLIQNGNVKSVMPSYNEVDGIPSHGNKWLLKDILRKEWRFDGSIVSDYFAITELFYNEGTVGHYLAGNKKDAAKLALEAGVNIELPDPSCYCYIKELLAEGTLCEKSIDDLVFPLLKQKFELGLFENPYVNIDNLDNDLKLKSDRPIALKAAEETIILLKNDDNILPFSKEKINKLAVIGPNADRELLGGYSGMPKYYSSVLDGIKEAVNNDVEVVYSEGCRITETSGWTNDDVIAPDECEDSRRIDEALKIAEQADVIVLALGGNEQTSREAWSTNHLGDRPSLNLLGKQNELVEKMELLGKPIIVLLFGGRPNSINSIAETIPAILQCWYLGQETGRAVANVLFGGVNPSGKLPISIPRSAGHIPAFYNYKPSARRGYLFDDTSALFPFGFGLSYTAFKVTNLRIEKNNVSIKEKANVSVDIKNVGSVKGSEVVQLYIRDKVSSVTRPVKELKGFKKVYLQSGETKTISFIINEEKLAFYNVDMDYIVEPGEFEIMLGTSSRDKDLLKTTLTIKG